MTDISLWLSAGAFGIALLSLYFSIRKQVFDEEMATADQTAILLSKLGEAKVLILKYRERIDALQKRCSQCGKLSPGAIEVYEKSMDLIDKALDLDMQELSDSTRISYRRLKLKKGHLDSQASVVSYLTQKMDELMQHCEGGQEREPSAAPLPRDPQTGHSDGER